MQQTLESLCAELIIQAVKNVKAWEKTEHMHQHDQLSAVSSEFADLISMHIDAEIEAARELRQKYPQEYYR